MANAREGRMKYKKLSEISPHILLKIGNKYGICYIDLMIRAGHIRNKKKVCSKCKGTGRMTIKHSQFPGQIGSVELPCDKCHHVRYKLPSISS